MYSVTHVYSSCSGESRMCIGDHAVGKAAIHRLQTHVTGVCDRISDSVQVAGGKPSDFPGTEHSTLCWGWRWLHQLEAQWRTYQHSALSLESSRNLELREERKGCGAQNNKEHCTWFILCAQWGMSRKWTHEQDQGCVTKNLPHNA